MKKLLTAEKRYLISLCFISFIFYSCITPKKIDSFIAEQYGNQLPKPARKKAADIEIVSGYNTNSNIISTTVKKTDKFLPLIVYWKYNHRFTSSLNPAIAVANFTNNINSVAGKELFQKLNGRNLELTVEQAPTTFSMVYKEDVIVLLIYAISWSKAYIQPEQTDLVVSYKLKESGNVIKSGTITIKNKDLNQNWKLFQRWKVAISDYLIQYNANAKAMTTSFIKQLSAEL